MTSKRRSTARLADDAYLDPYRGALAARRERADAMAVRLAGAKGVLADFALAHLHFGLHRTPGGWVLREWAPGASALWLVGGFSDWREADPYRFQPGGEPGEWTLVLPAGALAHGDLYRLRLHWPDGAGDRIPAFARRVVQDHATLIFNAQVWEPESPYAWQHAWMALDVAPLIYESHVGMAQERGGVGTYVEFREHVLPRIAAAGYNAVQLMAVAEHPYYGSFGYQVANFFAPSSRFGTPEELKHLVDDAHGLGLAVIIDLVHSHAAPNEAEGLARYDGTTHQFFHAGARGRHEAWGSCCFDYGKIGVLHFLLSNCRYWMDTFRVDGFRFDGVTSMLYQHHGLGPGIGSYADYFGQSVDEDALTYLTLANRVIHEVNPHAITIAEDVSGMPGLAAPAADGGCGFDFRLAMGVPDMWFKLIRDVSDSDWSLDFMWYELTNRRADERTISYVECHDQALVGGKTVMFQLADAAMYDAMHVGSHNLQIDRAVALHKMLRLVTLLSAGDGYLNFMGNEFGHPEWIDFPREGNNWSSHYARRQWHLADDPDLRYHGLAAFDRAMLAVAREGRAIETYAAQLVYVHSDDKVVAFTRGPLLVIANFHPTRSVVDYAVDVGEGAYRLVLDTDEGRFGGFDRLAPDQKYAGGVIGGAASHRRGIRVYVPARVALVARRVTGRSGASAPA